MPDPKVFEVNVTILNNTISGMEVTPDISAGGGRGKKSRIGAKSSKKNMIRKRNTKRKST